MRGWIDTERRDEVSAQRFLLPLLRLQCMSRLYMILAITLAKWTGVLPPVQSGPYLPLNPQSFFSFSGKEQFCSVKEIFPAGDFSSQSKKIMVSVRHHQHV